MEITNGRWVEIKTIPVEKVIGVRGTAFFIYNNEIVFSYYNEDNIRIGFDFNQKEYYLKYYKMPQEVSKEDLEEIVEQLLTEHYGDIYHLWMNHTDVDNFADKLDLNLNSRINLHKVYLEFCQKQYIRHNGYENPILNDKMSELLGDVEYFLGKKNYKKYVDVENYIELAE